MAQSPRKTWFMLCINVDGGDYAGWKADKIGAEELFRRAIHNEELIREDECQETDINTHVSYYEFSSEQDRDAACGLAEVVAEHLERDRGRHRNCYLKPLSEKEAQEWVAARSTSSGEESA